MSLVTRLSVPDSIPSGVRAFAPGDRALVAPLDACLGLSPTGDGFEALRLALRRSGGVAHGDDLARLLEDHRLGDYVSLARLVTRGDVFGFRFRAAFWIPMFQFDLRDLSLTCGVSRIVIELGESLDAWALAGWFVRPNPHLDERRPVDVLDETPADVLSAARASRASGSGSGSAVSYLDEHARARP